MILIFNDFKGEGESFGRIILVSVRIFYCLQLMNIFLKMDNMINSDWKDLFWPFWIIFSVLIGLSFTIFLILLTKFCSLCCTSTEKSECKRKN